MGGAFVPKQHNWRWYEDDAAEPTTPKVDENAFASCPDLEVFRLRVCIHETGGADGKLKSVDVEYSDDESTWYALGSQGATDKTFRWYNGKAAHGDILSSFLLSCTSFADEYYEQPDICTEFDKTKHTEIDVCIQNYNGSAGKTYYFRVKINGAEVPLDTSAIHPQLKTKVGVISGITKDKNGNPLGSCEVSLFRTIPGSPPTYDFVESTTSEGSGNYSFDIYDNEKYFVRAQRNDTPHIFDVTDNVLEGEVT